MLGCVTAHHRRLIILPTNLAVKLCNILATYRCLVLVGGNQEKFRSPNKMKLSYKASHKIFKENNTYPHDLTTKTHFKSK